MKTYIGIDPGQKGGIAILHERGATAIRMPERWVELRDFLLGVKGRDLVVILEKSQPMPKQGVTSTFNYGVGYGELRGTLLSFGFPFHEIRPAEWKKVILHGEPDKSDKGTSIRVCERLFPMVELVPERCRKPHDGMAEAVLLAEYGRRMNL